MSGLAFASPDYVGGILMSHAKLHDENGLKPLSCLFLDDVLCSYRKDQRLTVLSRCFKCPHYERWERMMDEEDAREDAEIEDILKNPEKYGYLRG